MKSDVKARPLGRPKKDQEPRGSCSGISESRDGRYFGVALRPAAGWRHSWTARTRVSITIVCSTLDTMKDDQEELYSVLERIQDVLESRPKYDFVNISLGPDLPIEDDDVHAWTAVLDQLFADGLTLPSYRRRKHAASWTGTREMHEFRLLRTA